MILKVLIEDKSIPPNAVPFGEDRNGQTFFIARAFLEVRFTTIESRQKTLTLG
jgi:hypothetical protein